MMGTIYIGADHRGFALKNMLKMYLEKKGYGVIDVGNHTYDTDDDYPHFAKTVAQAVRDDMSGSALGVLICGSGVGMSIVANKYKGVRAFVPVSVDHARAARRDDNVNVISFAADHIRAEDVKHILDAWLETPFSGEERHVRRLHAIDELGGI